MARPRPVVPPVRPLATYRLQFDAGFRLPDARAIVSYLHALGVSHLYASPLLRARAGSTHGYDVVDTTMLDPARGDARELERLATDLRERGMGVLLDIVPNHMAAGRENRAWDEMLTHGRVAPQARWFDVDWYSEDEELQGRVLVPVLGKPLGRAIADGELRLQLRGGAVRVCYWSNDFPLDPTTVPRVLTPAADALADRLGGEHPHVVRLRAILSALRALPPRTSHDANAIARRLEDALRLTAELEELAESAPVVKAALQHAVEEFGKGESGRRRLQRLLRAQVYELAYWRRAAREINYRRFFNIDELVALRMERAWVFEETHELILGLVGTALVDGLRVDHVDGLRDPQGYLERLVAAAQERRGAAVPVWVEKILADGERLRETWPVQGTTGYEALNELEALFVDPAGARRIVAGYSMLLGRARGARPFPSVARGAKRLVLATSLAADVRRLTLLLERWARADRRQAGEGHGGSRAAASAGDAAVEASGALPSRAALERALAATIAWLPVYRTYLRAGEPVHGDDRRWLRTALDGARAEADEVAVALLERALLPDEAVARGGDAPGDAVERARLRFVERFQQVTGPAAAKGVEDTALYRRVPLASLCEVGGEPDRDLEGALPRFHAACADRAAHWPATLVTVTTHDTKRSADVRARIDAIAALPDEWLAETRAWRSLARAHRGRVGRRAVPDVNMEWLLWQTLVGVWPVTDGHPDAPDPAALAELAPRVREYMRKAVREARERSSWVEPDEAHEAALDAFVDAVLDPQRAPQLVRRIHAMARRLARMGWWISLSRTLLHVAGPGTPDIYQGDELWNLALVDPDNRRPVDFVHRAALLGALEGAWQGGEERRRALLEELVARPADGRVKLHVLRRSLEARATYPDLFTRGSYAPLAPEGEHGDALVAFVREHARQPGLAGDAAIVLAARHPHRVVGTSADAPAPVGEVWGRTTVPLPERLHGRRWRCVLTGAVYEIGTQPLLIASILHSLPVALLLSSGDSSDRAPRVHDGR